MERRRSARMIQYLRKMHPGTWKYSPSAYEWRRAEDGLRVRRVSKMAPQFDGDDNSFVTETWAYPREGKPFQL